MAVSRCPFLSLRIASGYFEWLAGFKVFQCIWVLEMHVVWLAYILFISIPSACHYGAEVLYNGFA